VTGEKKKNILDWIIKFKKPTGLEEERNISTTTWYTDATLNKEDLITTSISTKPFIKKIEEDYINKHKVNINDSIKDTNFNASTSNVTIGGVASSKAPSHMPDKKQIPILTYENISQNIKDMYHREEVRYHLARLEEPAILTVALRHITRNLCENGSKITFPVPNLVDKITLRSSNLPIDPGELLLLIDQVCERRGTEFDLGETYKHFVYAHGRVAFDSRQPWPHCYVHTKYP
jgi:hypothetical protein